MQFSFGFNFFDGTLNNIGGDGINFGQGTSTSSSIKFFGLSL
ncbi:hypothetical protein V4P56_01255 [Bartonella sp. B35(2025)]